MGVSEETAVLLCLGTQKGLAVLQTALEFRHKHQFYVCTYEETAVSKSYETTIRELARGNGCELISLAEFRKDLLKLVDGLKLTSLMCVGWRYLVPSAIVQALNGNVIIAHDSLLPKLRGFAPLATAIISGEDETGVTFLRAGYGVDDGEVLWQGHIQIGTHDTIGVLIEKLLPLYSEGARLYLEGKLRHGLPQDDTQATYSIWRDEADYRIDWSRDAATIERYVRALGSPYLGAQCHIGGRTVTIHRATVLSDLKFAIRQSGKVWSLDDTGRPIVVCGSGLLRIDEATSNGESIIPFKSLRVRFN